MNITVYCGANFGNKEIYADRTKALGEWIVHRGHRLVYGGGSFGLMGLIADTVIKNGGKALGVIPRFLIEKEQPYPNLTELVYVDDMSQRKNRMVAEGDAFIALPGGLGTLEEIAEVVSWARVGQNDCPCIFYNVDGYYNPIRTMFDDMVSSGFLSQSDRDKTLFSEDLEEMAKFIATYEPPIF